MLPDPSWFPNTVGIGMTSIKLWLYHPNAGYFLMSLSIVACFTLFPIALYRVYVNKKIAATVCWMIVSGPSSALYAATLMSQPTLAQEDHMDIETWKHIHVELYMPFLTLIFLMAVAAMFTSVYSLYVRWDHFKQKGFSPAYVAFCFPTLNHANMCQAFRSGVDAFMSDLVLPGSFLKIALYIYW